jgi:hypothetical protein
MAKRLFFASLTFTAQAYSATVLANSSYMCLLGTSTTQLTDVLEILATGQQGSSTVSGLQLCRSLGTVPSGATALAAPASDGPMHPATAALASPVSVFVAATTNPQASGATTDAKLNLGVNFFGGAVRWNASPFQQWSMYGSATGFGCSVLFNSSVSNGVTGLADAHIMYETY